MEDLITENAIETALCDWYGSSSKLPNLIVYYLFHSLLLSYCNDKYDEFIGCFSAGEAFSVLQIVICFC